MDNNDSPRSEVPIETDDSIVSEPGGDRGRVVSREPTTTSRSIEYYRRIAIFVLGGILTIVGITLLVLAQMHESGMIVFPILQNTFWYEFTAANFRLGLTMLVLGFAWNQLIRMPRWVLIVSPLLMILFVACPRIIFRLVWSVGIALRSLIPAVVGMLPLLIGVAPLLFLLYLFRKSVFKQSKRRKRGSVRKTVSRRGSIRTVDVKFSKTNAPKKARKPDVLQNSEDEDRSS